MVRRAPDGRLVAYRDFTAPRRRAAANPRNLVNGGTAIARFTRAERARVAALRAPASSPTSRAGLIDVTHSHSRAVRGRRSRRYRILSRNGACSTCSSRRRGSRWIGYPQPLTTELSSFGVRTVDVTVPDDLVVPAMEYHYLEFDEPPVWMSQIPPGFAGPVSPNDAFRADASAWLDRLPVIVEFRALAAARRRAWKGPREVGGRAGAPRRAGQHREREHVGRHQQQRVRERRARGLQPELQRAGRAEQQRAGDDAQPAGSRRTGRARAR